MTTNNILTLPAFKGQNVRAVETDGTPWFVASDICRILGLAISPKGQPNVTMALVGLDADETGFSEIETTSTSPKGRRTMAMRVVSEPGLYKLIARSNKPEAKEFDRWVRHVVLPSIRKTGGYLLNEAARDTAHADTREAMPLPA